MTGASLRRRGDGSIELRVNGVFVMDDVETSSERALARSVLDAGARDVLVGGLGLGFTAHELLADPAVTRVTVAEIHAEISDWMRDGTIAGAELFDDPRFDLRIGDVRDIVDTVPAASLDAILLDVDNGPDFLVYEDKPGCTNRRSSGCAPTDSGLVDTSACGRRPTRYRCAPRSPNTLPG